MQFVVMLLDNRK